MVIRTLIIDDLIENAVAAGIDTVVNLGAGLDARPYRMKLPESLHWIEVDYPQVIDWKADKLAAIIPAADWTASSSISPIWRRAARCSRMSARRRTRS